MPANQAVGDANESGNQGNAANKPTVDEGFDVRYW